MTEYMTIRGFVATAPESRTLPGSGTAVASFRLASTQRWYDAQTKEWRERHTNWFTVSCFRQLAGNVASSVFVGQPVIVQGKLRIKNWESEGIRRSTAEIEAVSLGPDLAFGTASFSRNSSSRNAGHRSPDSEGRSEDPADGATGHWGGIVDQQPGDQQAEAPQSPDFVDLSEEAPAGGRGRDAKAAENPQQDAGREGTDPTGMTESSQTDREILAMT